MRLRVILTSILVVLGPEISGQTLKFERAAILGPDIPDFAIPRPPVFADFNRDGQTDLIVASDKSVWLFLNRGGGQFLPPVAIGDFGPYDAGDLNGDGNPDILLGGASTRVLSEPVTGLSLTPWTSAHPARVCISPISMAITGQISLCARRTRFWYISPTATVHFNHRSRRRCPRPPTDPSSAISTVMVCPMFFFPPPHTRFWPRAFRIPPCPIDSKSLPAKVMGPSAGLAH